MSSCFSKPSLHADSTPASVEEPVSHVHEAQAFNCVLRGNRILLRAISSVTLKRVPVPAAVVAVDASGSMTYNGTARVPQARLCAKTVEAASPVCSITKFGRIWEVVPNADSFFIGNDVGTAFVAAGNGLAASYQHIALLQTGSGSHFPPVNAVFITDCEGVGDRLAARKVFEALPLTGAVIFIGIGDQHTISSLMAVAPERCEGQVFYIKVPESTLGTALDKLGVFPESIVEALLSVPISFVIRDAHGRVTRSVDARVLKGADYLFPAGVQLNDVFLYGKPLSTVAEAVVTEEDDATMTVQQLQQYSAAATLNIVRAYNFALAKLELEPHSRVKVMSHVIDLATRELSFISDLRRRVSEERISRAEIERARTAIKAVASGAACSTSNADLRRTVRRMRDPSGSSMSAADEIVDILRTLRNRICEPPSAASLILANNLLDALGSGNMGSSKVARLLGKTAQRQDAGLYASVANDLQVYEDAMEARAADAPSEELAFSKTYASPEADLLDSMVATAPARCTATFETVGCMVAVGSLKRVLAGSMNPLLTRVLGASREPYKIQAVRLCGDDGFRASAGFANGIIGVFPGDSVGAAIAFKLISSYMATGDWNTDIHGLRPLLALLSGVVYLFTQLQTSSVVEFAETLTHGFLGVAARIKCRVLGPDGTADLTTPVVSGLTACRDLLLRAFSAPHLYAGNAIMGADYWTALEFAMRYAAPRLGENYIVPDRPADFTAAVVASGISRFATFFITPAANTDDRLAFDMQKRAIDQFVKLLPLYIGKLEVSNTEEDTEDDIRNIRFLYEARDVKKTSRQEEHCISVALDFAKRFDCSSEGVALVNSVRAVFWEAVMRPNSSLQRLVAVYTDPIPWELAVADAAKELRDEHRLQKDAMLRKLCEKAFLNAATSLPVALYGVGFRRVRVQAFEVDVTLSLGNDHGMLPRMPTGMLDVCLAIDSEHFLRNKFVKYIQESYAETGQAREKTFFPRFHAEMTAWAKTETTLEAFMEKAGTAWPAACPRHLGDSVRHWLWQRAAFKAVASAAIPIDTESIVAQCSIELNMSGLDTRAADWDAECSAESAAVAAMYGDNTQWSYYRAVVEFYAALRIDTDVFTRVFNATPFLENLRLHRGFVVSQRMYRASLTLHGVTEADLDDIVCKDVYAETAMHNLH